MQAAIPPGYRVQFGGPAEDDRPRLPDGRIPPRRVANNGSLASPHIRDYTEALIRDLCRAYPEIDGIRVDWPEYPPYLLDDVFLDFGPPAQRAAERLGFPFETHAARCRGRLYRLLARRAARTPNAGRRRWPASRASWTCCGSRPRWWRNCWRVSARALRGRRSGQGTHAQRLPAAVQRSPPAWTYARAARCSAAISVKLYTMHWPMMLRFYGDALREANPGAERDALVVRALARWFDISDDGAPARLADYRYPEPEERHPVGLEAQARKIAQARADAGAARSSRWRTATAPNAISATGCAAA